MPSTAGSCPNTSGSRLYSASLLHDTRQSHSLLEQLGAKASLQFLDTRHRPVAAPGSQIAAPHDVPMGMVLLTATLSAAPEPHGEWSWRVVPVLGSDPERSQSRKHFEAWWRDSIIGLRSGETFTRSDFVLDIAHREGGAHVDPDPPVQWVLLRDRAGTTPEVRSTRVGNLSLSATWYRRWSGRSGTRFPRRSPKQRATLAH